MGRLVPQTKEENFGTLINYHKYPPPQNMVSSGTHTEFSKFVCGKKVFYLSMTW